MINEMITAAKLFITSRMNFVFYACLCQKARIEKWNIGYKMYAFPIDRHIKIKINAVIWILIVLFGNPKDKVMCNVHLYAIHTSFTYTICLRSIHR